MYCTKKITDDLIWVGANDRRLAMFEGVYSVPNGVSYNSYLLLDDTTVLFDTVDKAVGGVFFQNVEHALGGRNLDFVVIQHMEPDHSATLGELLLRYPDVKVVCNQKILDMITQFFNLDLSKKAFVVKEGTTLNTGHHTLRFFMAPMVHWPEVIMTYDAASKTLFSADAFGKFGALDTPDGAEEDGWACEARRYYFGIVGKFGKQVQAVLKKAAALDIQTICPLHGPVLTEDLGYYLNLYNTWSSYESEDKGVTIAYCSVYGHTKQAALALAQKLQDAGVPSVSVFDLARDDMAEAVEDAFRYDRLVLVSTTYNGDMFPFMKDFINHLIDHAYQNRTIALMESGSWAPTAARVMRAALEGCKNLTFAETVVTLRGALEADAAAQEQMDALVAELAQ